MSNSYFAFKQFVVRQEHCAMKVGTDGVLLGAWAGVHESDGILDIGSGTGLIALICAQRSDTWVHAVEIDKEAACQSGENFLSSPWKDRLSIFHNSFQQFAAGQHFKYDLLISNPPYFRNALKSPERSRSIARHDHHLSYEALVHYAPQLMSPRGKMAIILPFSERNMFTHMAFTAGLHLTRQLLVKPYAGKAYSRWLAEFSLNQENHVMTEELEIRQEDAAGYTEAYIALTKDLYLHF